MKSSYLPILRSLLGAAVLSGSAALAQLASSAIPSVTTVALAATQNATIDQSNPSTNFPGNYGGQTVLSVSNASGAVNQAYLQYSLSGLSGVQSAKLRFFVDSNNATPGTTVSVSVYSVGGSSPNSWTETGLTYSTASSSWPANTGSNPLGSPLNVYPVTQGLAVVAPTPIPARYYEVDVTPSVQAAWAGSGAISFVLASSGGAIIELDSREGPRPPQLIISNATNTITASDNTYVDEVYPTHDNGSSTTLAIKGTPGFIRQPYLKFNLAGISSISSAKLRFYVDSITGSTTVTANGVGGSSPNSWTGNGTGYLDWSTSATWPLGTAGGSVAVAASSAYYEVDVTALAQASAGGLLSVILTAPNDGSFTAIDSGSGTNYPALIVGSASGVWAPGAQNTNRGAAGATGTVYYIDSVSGNDSNAGTSPAMAWKTVANVNAFASENVSVAGDAFLFCARGPSNPYTVQSGTQTLITSPGCNGVPVIYGSYDPAGTGLGQAYIQAPGGTAFNEAVAVSSWTVIRDLFIQGSSTAGEYSSCTNTAPGTWLVQGEGTDVLIQNCTVTDGAVGIDAVSSLYQDQSARWDIVDTTVYNVGGTGVYVYGDNFVVRNCLIHDWEQIAESNWGASQHGVYSRARQLEVYGSELYRYSSIATTGQALSPRGRDNVIEGNRIHDVAELAIGFYPDNSNFVTNWGTGTSIIRYNTFWNIGNSIFFASSSQGSLAEHWVAYNNTADGLGSATIGMTAFDWNHLTGGATARNNAATWYSNPICATPAAGTLLVDHNFVDTPIGLGIPVPPGSPSTTTQWVPAPLSGSELLNAGASSIDAGITIVNYPGSAPNAGSY